VINRRAFSFARYEATACLSVGLEALKVFRSVGLWIFPVALRGSASTNSMRRGHLNRARLAWQCAWISSALSVWPGFTATIAMPTSPHCSLGMPMMAASATAASWCRTLSTSAG